MSNPGSSALRRARGAALRRTGIDHAPAARPLGGALARVAEASARNIALWALAAVAAASAIVATMTLTGAPAVRHDAPSFLQRQLGAAAPAASLARTGAGVSTRITPTGLAFDNTRTGASMALASQDVVSGSGAPIPWVRHESGALRSTPFGNEAIVFRPGQVEQLMTVGKRVGVHTWSWRLDNSLGYPRVGDDGYVAFIKDHAVRQDVVLHPVQLFDAKGRDITPAGLHWEIAQDGRGYLLQLRLDDAALPVPYVIDPIASTGAGSTTATAADATSIASVNKYTGVADGDLAVAMVSSGKNTGASVTLTANGNAFALPKNASQSITTFTHLLGFVRILQAGDAAGTWAFSDGGAGSDGAQSFAIVTAGFTGVQAGSVAGQPGIDIANAANATATAPAITPNQNNEVVIWGVGSDAADTFGGGNGTAAVAGGSASSGSATNTSVDLRYSIGSTAGTPVTPTAVTGTSGAHILAQTLSFRVSDTTNPTKTDTTFKKVDSNTIEFTFDDSTGVGVAPTVPLEGRFTAHYTPTGGGTVNLNPSSATISTTGSTGTVTLDFTGTPFANPGTITLDYSNSNTSSALSSNFATAGTTMSVANTSYFRSSGNVLVTGNSTTSLGVAYVYTQSAKSNTTLTVTAKSSLPSSIGTSGSSVSNRLQDRDGNPLASFTNQPVYSDGTGTIAVSPSTVGSSSVHTYTFTYTVPASGLNGGSVTIDFANAVADGWSTPSTTTTAAGYIPQVAAGGTCGTPGNVTLAGNLVTISNSTCTSGQTLTFTYGNTGGGGPGASAPAGPRRRVRSRRPSRRSSGRPRRAR